jgi:hypothetical protein
MTMYCRSESPEKCTFIVGKTILIVFNIIFNTTKEEKMILRPCPSLIIKRRKECNGESVEPFCQLVHRIWD